MLEGSLKHLDGAWVGISLERDLEKVSHNLRLTNDTSSKDTLVRHMLQHLWAIGLILPFKGSVSALSMHQDNPRSHLTMVVVLCSICQTRHSSAG